MNITHPTLSTYTIPLPLPAGRTASLVHISDLHTDHYGDCSDEAAALIRAQQPDALVCTGDMLDCRRDHTGRFFFRLLDRLPDTPVIISPGNHEQRIALSRGLTEFDAECRARGIIQLKNRDAWCRVGGADIHFYGYLQPFYTFTRHGKTRARLRQDVTAADVAAALGECPADEPVILLAHDPAPFAAYAAWGAPLTLSGHIHGGGIRLPLVGGLVSPARRFFPKYSAGIYERTGHRLIVSRGLCIRSCPRIGNPPEVARIDLVPRAADTAV